MVRSLGRHVWPLVFALLGTACEGEPETVVVLGDDAVIVENSHIRQESRGAGWTSSRIERNEARARHS